MIYCKKCGAELPESAKFCVNCGTPVKGGANYWVIVAGIILVISGLFTIGGVDFDFTSLGMAVGYAVGTTVKVAIPVVVIAFIVKLFKRK